MMNKYNKDKIEWLCLKILFMFWWIPLSFVVLFNYTSIPLPVSVWRWIPMVGQLPEILKYILCVLLIFAALMFLFEKKMTIITSLLAFLSILIFSMEESNGVYNRYMTLSALLAAIAIAYILQYYNPSNNLIYNRIQFPTQIIAATYILAGLSKLKAAGFAWVISGKYFSLQVLKAHYSEYYQSGNENYLTAGQAKVDFIQNNMSLLTLLLGFSLLLELNAWLMLVFPEKKKLYALLLLVVHIGIYIMMDIIIYPIVIPMIIILLNPLYLSVLFVQNIKSRLFKVV